MTPLAPERYALQVTIGQGTHDKLRRVQELLSHALPSGNVAEVLDRALDALIRELEKRKFAATSRPRAGARASEDPRHIPAHVKRAVMSRDEGRCTFVSDCGRRCSSRKFLEFDHVTEVARGGTATISGIRLRCRAHNQYTAERTFGAGFMDAKRHSPVETQTAGWAREAASAPAAEQPTASNHALATTAADHSTASVARCSISSATERPITSAAGGAGSATVSREPSEVPSLAETFARARLDAITRTPSPELRAPAATARANPIGGPAAPAPAVRACSG